MYSIFTSLRIIEFILIQTYFNLYNFDYTIILLYSNNVDICSKYKHVFNLKYTFLVVTFIYV